MPQDDFLVAQLKQVQAALETAQRLQRAAEAQRATAVEQLKDIAAALLTPEWNVLKRERPGVTGWPPEELGAWIIEAGTRKLNRLELSASGDSVAALEVCVQERDRWREEARQLQREAERLAVELGEATTRLQAQEDELRRLREEASRLRLRVAELAVPAQPTLPEPGEPSSEGEGGDRAWLQEWRGSPDYARDVEALRVIGAQGFVLRESVARVLGMNPRSGTTSMFFRRLRDQRLIEEKPAKAEVAGRPPNLLRLTDRGRLAYHALFGQEPVEPEDDRLLRRHKSEEQVVLALQARAMLEGAGAEMVDLFPAPAPLPGGGKFEADLVAVVEGKKVYVECERAASRKKRLNKWSQYARLTGDFYFFVPNKDALNRLMTELNYWAYRRVQDAAGVTVHICQLTESQEGELWHLVRPLGGRR